VCGVVGGAASSVSSSAAGGWLAESAKETGSGLPVAAPEWCTNQIRESPNETVRTDGVALRRALLHDYINAWCTYWVGSEPDGQSRSVEIARRGNVRMDAAHWIGCRMTVAGGRWPG
jgi:hypothetical protein